MEWLATALRDLKLQPAIEPYHKGDEFKGILFAKFASPQVAQTITESFSKARPNMSGKHVWCKFDQPIEARVPKSFLLGLRWQLVQWGFEKQDVRVDDEHMIMKVGGVPVLQVVIDGQKLNTNWLDSSWALWPDLQQSKELQTLVQSASDKLKASFDNRAKGNGKGTAGKGQQK